MRNFWMIAALCAGAFTITACSEGDQQQAEEAMEDAQTTAEQAMDDAGDAADEAMTEAGESMDDMDDAADEAMAEEPAADSNQVTATLEEVDGSGVSGQVEFTAMGEDIQVYAEASGLAAGKHAFHVHANGDCGDNAQAAGPHLKFPSDGDDDIHGNLGEFNVADSGSDNELITLSGLSMDVIRGKAVVVHEKGNDHSSPPVGAAGGRIACGVIN
ncbi:superoxide dismutase family protein [Spectribacter hydrogenoxidans]|uniref:Superoxide dismutase family protein n=1 Tax=Spectribacter hydrogenoxidans TaxID=3075608 RepID=A0ABU3BWL3_9GAMM|nr:superoxide dismutase family protein [Salinisphaera sp. W335]MDT0633687.1 superoxide dismutase family protein [Salinisphaera sp. W335]